MTARRSRPTRSLPRIGIPVLALVLLLPGCGSTPAAPPRADTTPTSASPTTATRTTTAPRSTTPPAPTSPTVARNGAVVTTLGPEQAGTLLPAQDGFVVVRASGAGATDTSRVTAYDRSGRSLATLSYPAVTGDCGAADVVVGTRRILLTRSITVQPAAGIDPELYSDTLNAWDARTGTPLWEVPIIAPQQEPFACSVYDTGLEGVSITADGRYAAVGVGLTTGRLMVVDLTDGTARDLPGVVGTLGTWVVRDTSGNGSRFAVVDPGTLADTAVLPDPDDGGPFFTSPTTGIDPDGFDGTRDTPGGAVAFGSTDGAVTAYSLPAWSPVWTVAPSGVRDVTVVASSDTVALLRVEAPDYSQTVVGVDVASGAQLWTLPDFTVCGLTTSQVFVEANDQWAVLDARTGQQLGYGPQDTASTTAYGSCETTPQGLTSVDTGSGRTVFQAIQP